MKLNEKMRYPHPVLSEYSSDYTTGELSATFKHQQGDTKKLRILSTLNLNSPALSELISDQKAACGYFIVCRQTYFNRLQTVSLGDAERFFEIEQLHGSVNLRPVIWTLEAIDGYSSPLMDAEFGESVPIPKGSIIAMGPEFRLSVDPQRFKPFETIFAIAKSDSVAAGTIAVDTDREKITVLAEKDTYDGIAGLRQIAKGKRILLNAVYMPAVMEVISRLQSGDTSLHGRQWYRVFSAKCDEMGIDPSDKTESPLDLAQQLLREPLVGTIKVMESA